jgi:hypothetical protein
LITIESVFGALVQRPRIAPKIAPFFLEELRRIFAAAVVGNDLGTGGGVP